MRRYYFVSYLFVAQNGNNTEQGFGNVATTSDGSFSPLKTVQEIHKMSPKTVKHVVIQSVTEITAEAWTEWDEAVNPKVK